MDAKTTSDEATSVEQTDIWNVIISEMSTALQFYCQATSSRKKGVTLSKVSRQSDKMQMLVIKWTRTLHNMISGDLQSQNVLANFSGFQQSNVNLLDFKQQIVCHVEYPSPTAAISWSYFIFCYDSGLSLPGLRRFLLVIDENITYLSRCRSRFGWTPIWSSRHQASGLEIIRLR